MNYIEKFMSENDLHIEQRFKITRFPRLVFYFDDMFYLCVDGDDYIQRITDTEHILYMLLRGDFEVASSSKQTNYVSNYDLGRFAVFDLLTSAEYGKNCYFLQDNGAVYSRRSGKYMSFDDAIVEFIKSQEWDDM